MTRKAFSLLFLVTTHFAFAQTDLACPTEKLRQEDGPAKFCDSLRQRKSSDWIYADLRISNIIDPSSGDTSIPAVLKERCLYILTKYDIYQFYPREKIPPTDSTYMSVNGGVLITKETALNLVQEDYVLFVNLGSVPRTPETPPHWPTTLFKHAQKLVQNKHHQEIDVSGRTFLRRGRESNFRLLDNR